MNDIEQEMVSAAVPEAVDRPSPLPPVRGRGFVLERLLTLNAVVSVLILSWSALVLRKPVLAQRAWAGFCKRFSWLVGGFR